MTSPFRLLAALLLAGRLAAAGASSTLPVSLDPASLNRFWLDANERVELRLRAPRRDLRLIFKDPAGMVWELAAPTDAAPGPETVYGTILERPMPGPWTLAVVNPGEPVAAALEIAYTSQVHPRLALTRTTLVQGEPLTVSLELLDHAARVKELRTLATVTRLDVETVPEYVALHDDGTHGDRIARDGLLTATLAPESAGRFRLMVQIEGTASGGRFHRTASATYLVVPKGAELTGRFSQRILIGSPD